MDHFLPYLSQRRGAICVFLKENLTAKEPSTKISSDKTSDGKNLGL